MVSGQTARAADEGVGLPRTHATVVNMTLRRRTDYNQPTDQTIESHYSYYSNAVMLYSGWLSGISVVSRNTQLRMSVRRVLSNRSKFPIECSTALVECVVGKICVCIQNVG